MKPEHTLPDVDLPGGARRWLLFVAGNERNSSKARANLERLRADCPPGACEVEVVDVLDDFQAALEHEILVTPALVQLGPGPRVVVLGCLSDLDRVRAALGIETGMGSKESLA